MSAHYLLTGATGFVGKVVLAELLRRSAELGVERVYVLIRPKRGKTPQERFAEQLASSPLFAGFEPGWAERVVPIAGDLAAPGADLSEADAERLRAEVTHLIHCAASVEFDLPIQEAASANIVGSLNMLELARTCRRLQRMVAVSTAYVTPWRAGPIGEALAPLPFDAEATYEAIRSGKADEAALLKASGHPNTYTLTKCLAEHLLANRQGDVPLSIVRPSIVSATWRHPQPGWIDSSAAFAAFVALTGGGYARALVVDPETRLDIVPCDVVADGILQEAARSGAERELLIRHAVVGPERCLPISLAMADIPAYFAERGGVERHAEIRWFGRPGGPARLMTWWHHTLPARSSAIAMRLVGRDKLAKSATRLAATLKTLTRVFPYFTHHTFEFATARPLAIEGFTQASYLDRVCEGVSRHLLKRDPRASSLAGKHHRDPHRSDWAWALKQPTGGFTLRAFGVALRKLGRLATDRVTYDHQAFQRARAQVPADMPLVLVPSHRSYADFLVCSFLTFARPALGIRIPFIAASAEFGKIPLLGAIFTRSQAFYVRRGLGREDTELTRQVHGLIDRGEVIEFFIEGARSRSRRFLLPRTGLLRAMQATGRPFAVLPVAIGYDRVPEEPVLARELSGLPKPDMSLRATLGWLPQVLRGQIALGRVHLTCAEPVICRPGDDVRETASRIMAGLQGCMPISTYHLRCFLAKAAPAGVDLDWLRGALVRRGALVIDSDLGCEDAVEPVTEQALREQWLSWFYPDALRRFPDHPVVRHCAESHGHVTPDAGRDEGDRLNALLDAAFGPLRKDAAVVLDHLGAPPWAPRYATPASMLPEVPGVHLVNAQATFEALVTAGILAIEDKGFHAWGPQATELDAFAERCRPAPVAAPLAPSEVKR